MYAYECMYICIYIIHINVYKLYMHANKDTYTQTLCLHVYASICPHNHSHILKTTQDKHKHTLTLMTALTRRSFISSSSPPRSHKYLTTSKWPAPHATCRHVEPSPCAAWSIHSQHNPHLQYTTAPSYPSLSRPTHTNTPTPIAHQPSGVLLQAQILLASRRHDAITYICEDPDMMVCPP